MKVIPLALSGAYLLIPKAQTDVRGSFSRLFCSEALASSGLNGNFVQMNRSFSKKKGTLRGIHYQLPPSEEEKLVCCSKGAIFDVLIDMREQSPTFKQAIGEKLSDFQGSLIYIPKGVAHGFVTLEEETEVVYLATAKYDPLQERGIRFDDPEFSISWPVPPTVFSEKSTQYPFFDPIYHLDKKRIPT